MAIGQAVQETLESLAISRSFVEQPLRGAGGRTYAQTEAYTPADRLGEGVLSPIPFPNFKDVHVSIDVDMGGSPGSVKNVAGIISRIRLKWVSNTIQVSVCPCTKD